MGKKSKSKSESKPTEVEGAKVNDSSDIFKLLFGREAPEEQGLGLDSNPRNVEIIPQAETDSGELKKKKKKREKSDLDVSVSESIVEEPEKAKKSKKTKEVDAESNDVVDEKEKKGKRKTELKHDSDVDSEVKKRKKEKDREVALQVVPTVDKRLEQKGEEIGDLKDKKKKKKRKRDEVEEAYEAKAYGVVANVEEGDKKANWKVGEKRKSMDDPAEMMVSKEGFDDETKLLRTVFVGNLPLKLKKKDILKEFTKFGEVESVRIRSIPIVDSKTPRKGAIMKGKINEAVDSVHAYIVFKDEKSAQASLSHNMAMVEGNHIRVDKACPPRKKLKGDNAPVYDNQRTVFVGNLPFDVKDEEVYQLFCGINQAESSIEGVRVIRDPSSSIGKGIAYVLFKTKEAANLVIKKRHLKIRDRILRFYHAKSDTTPSKKRDQPSTTQSENPRRKRFGLTSPLQDENKTKAKGSLSYQGLKATKTIQKKELPKKDKFRPRTGEQKQTPGVETKERKSKRPAVAARKAKALKIAGGKRKSEGRSPESFNRNKKARKF